MIEDSHKKHIWLFLSKDNQIVFFDGNSQYPLNHQEHRLTLDANSVYSGASQSWRDFLPEQCIQSLYDFLQENSNNFLFLHIHKKLDGSWTDYPWEYLSIHGTYLFGRIVVERDSVLITKEFKSTFVNPKASSIFLNMFPLAELKNGKFPYEDYKKKKNSIHSMAFQRTYKLSRNFCKIQDLSSLGFLTVFIHGSEQDDSSLPFLLPDKNKTYWELPSTALPPLIVLLSCGSDSGNLSNYSRKLLKSGAICVLSAVGKINSTKILSFSSELWNQWQEGKCIGEILKQAQGKSNQEDGALRLRIFGQANICLEPENLSIEIKDSPNIANSLIRDYTKTKKLDLIKTRILLERAVLTQELFGIPWDVEFKRWVEIQLFKVNSSEFLQSICPLANKFSLSIKCHLYPLLIFLAEKDTHFKMNELGDKYSLDMQNCKNLAANLYRVSLFYYRNGEYKEVFRHYLSAMNQKDWPAYQSHFYRLLLSISTDLLLPIFCEIYDDKLKNSLDDFSDSVPVEVVKNERWASMDVQSRYLLRIGDYYEAYELMLLKQDDADKYDSNRENAWLLYISSLGCLESARNDADTILNEINDFDSIIEKWDSGNSDIAYQIRALSLWCCQNREEEIATKLLDSLLETISKLLKQNKVRDYAPIGFSLVFLNITATKTPDEFDCIWARVSTRMKKLNYHAELMGLYAILNDKENALKSLKMFHRFRRNMLKPLLFENSNQNDDIYSIDYNSILQDKECIESEAVNNLPEIFYERIKYLVEVQIMPQ